MCIFLPVMTRNMVDLKDRFLKIDEKFNEFKIAIIADLREQIKTRGFRNFRKRNQEKRGTGIHCLHAKIIRKK